MTDRPLVCEMERDGYHESKCYDDRADNFVYLVVGPDRENSVYCAGCIKKNMELWDIGTLFYSIGDDVTGKFL